MPTTRATINYAVTNDDSETTFHVEITADVSLPVSDAFVAGGSWEPGEGASADIIRVTCEKIVNTYGSETVDRKPGHAEAAAIGRWMNAGNGLADVMDEVRVKLADEVASIAARYAFQD